MQQRAASLFVVVLIKLRPAVLEEAPHGVSSLAHLRRVLVEEFAVAEDQLSVGSKLLTAAVPETHGRKHRCSFTYQAIHSPREAQSPKPHVKFILIWKFFQVKT